MSATTTAKRRTRYFPAADVGAGLLTPDGRVAHRRSRGDAEIYCVHAGGQQRTGAALHYKHSPFDELRDTIRLDWNAMDACFERTPLPESQKITGLVCFYPERVDIYVDGQLVQ